jgi:glycosyltransferase involved in cell wall biosynthesis
MDIDSTFQQEYLRELLSRPDNLIVMYVGNLEAYQGIDLLLQGFALAAQATPGVDLFVIGGEAVDIHAYTKQAAALGLAKRVHFLGPRPVQALSYYLSQADILASPRIMGKNTPMKIYSYLGSGKAVIATNLETHTQVLTTQIALLVEPYPQAFADGLLALVQDSALRQALGAAGQQMIRENFSLSAFRQRAHSLLDWVQAKVTADLPSVVKS